MAKALVGHSSGTTRRSAALLAFAVACAKCTLPFSREASTLLAPGQVVALLNLGASVMNINIVKGTTPLFPRDVSVGGHQYTDSLQKELDLSFDDAESLKLGNKVGTVSEDAKQPILQQVTEIIVLEIQKTFDFFRATAAGVSTHAPPKNWCG